MIKPPFCRLGNKTPILKEIIELIPQYKIYCEPFVGSAVVFFNLPKVKLSILNDLDKDVYNRLKLLQKAPLDITKYRHDLNTLEKVKDFYVHHNNTINDLLLYHKISACSGFNCKPVKDVKHIYNNRYNAYFLKHLEYYKKMLAGVKITNQDYIKIIVKYDSPDTFFFIDPPYENTDKAFYSDISMDYHELSFLLQNIKGKFLLTINDSPNIRKIFKPFKIKKINVRGSPWGSEKTKIRKELFIMNY
jgi:DNA adenine methylase